MSATRKRGNTALVGMRLVTSKPGCGALSRSRTNTTLQRVMVLAGISMTEFSSFLRQGWRMLYQKRCYPACATCWRIALINASILLLLRLR